MSSGWHALGLVSNDGKVAGALPANFGFDDPFLDESLTYQR